MKRVKRLIPVLLCLLLSAACADGALSKSMPAGLTAGKGLTAEEWLADEDSRALLTVTLWRDYCAVADAAPCPADGLTSGSLVARHDESGYLLIVIPAEEGRLLLYYLPESGTAAWMWEGGDYGTEYKVTALENHGMTVWENTAEAITPLLEE